MHNLIILYNPYYQADVIDTHLSLLNDNGKVAFGKIESKIKDMVNEQEEQLSQIYNSVSEESFLQLFLSDYSNLYVAKIIAVTSDDMSSIAPSYYAKNDFNVEQWFIISDIRELVRNDFELVRDRYLANFIAPNNHTFALYGNSYVYPLIVRQKEQINYFLDNDIKHYTDIYKTPEFLEIKNSLINYAFGKWAHYMHPDSMQNIISAEIEYQSNRQNPLYDFTSVAIKYSKTFEKEIYLFMQKLFELLGKRDSRVLEVEYSVQDSKRTIADIATKNQI